MSIRMSKYHLPAKRLLAASALLSCVLAGGCGPEGPRRYEVSGTVTYQGSPIPFGTILFVPDSAKGNTGPSGQATIRDGKFDTAAEGVGAVGGPHLLTIDASRSGGVGEDAGRPPGSRPPHSP
jgi:hypothetical protein